jgi:hypothetical protein
MYDLELAIGFEYSESKVYILCFVCMEHDLIESTNILKRFELVIHVC